MNAGEFDQILPASNRLVSDDEQQSQLADLSSEDDRVLKVYKLSLKLDKLKAIVDFPRFYLANYFEGLRNEVDLVATRLTTAEDIIFPIERKLKENWLLIIKKIKTFEDECIKRLPNSKLSMEIYVEFAQIVKQLEIQLNELNSSKNGKYNLKELDDEIYNETERLKKILFLNKTYVFLEQDQSKIEDYFKQVNMDYCVGKLLCINTYLGKRGLSRITSKYKLNEYEKKIIDNESVKSEIIVKLITKKYITKNTIDSVDIDFNEMTKFDCNSRDLDAIDSRSFKDLLNLAEIRLYNNNFLKLNAGLFKSLVNLTNVYMSNNKLSHLDENIFKDCHSLIQIDLKYNCLESLSSNIFKGLKNLTHIYLSGNKLKRLDFNIFEGLTKLNGIYLSSNKLEVLEPDLFNSNLNLTEIYLRENKLRKLDKNLFKGLHKLTYLRINNNKLETLDPEIFIGLVNLTGVWLDDNRIKHLDASVFSNLPKLELINLSNNKLFNSEETLFECVNKSLVICK